MRVFLLFLGLLLTIQCAAQGQKVRIVDAKSFEPVPSATIKISQQTRLADEQGWFQLTGSDSGWAFISAAGYRSDSFDLSHAARQILLHRTDSQLQEVVVSGTMRSVKRSNSAIAVELYSPKFFMKNPTPSLFDALQLVNGIRPQLNCNVCNTGDIHINGMEGPYTLILIDGMPIVSSLASVYGISGIPNSLIERVEVVKGPASSLYGSEAMGGLINVMTKNPLRAPRFSIDLSSSSMQEWNADLSMSYKPAPQISALAGISGFWFNRVIDKNNDGFTDITLQKRISVFNKYSFARADGKTSQLAMRYLYEDRWGGEVNWNKSFRAGDSVYGESIYTSRFELVGNHPILKGRNLNFSYSFNAHVQRSAYGATLFNAQQKIGFAQLTYTKDAGDHHLLSGLVGRYSFYDDNTPVTHNSANGLSKPDQILVPGLFLQHEWDYTGGQQLLSGLRFDYDRRHGLIFTPRVAWKYQHEDNIVRLNAGTGFRVVNVFTEDHAALTGAREVVLSGELKPERSINLNVNYTRKLATETYWLNIDASAWYTYFFNRILPDYTTDPNRIFYNNLNGYARSVGFSLNLEAAFVNSLRINSGFTVMDISVVQELNGQKQRQRPLLTEKWSGTWAVSYTIRRPNVTIDYTGNMYGSMLLPLASALDPRSPASPIWSIQNIQFSVKPFLHTEIYGGVKNILNWTPARSAPFLIARAEDPFDKQVVYDSNGRVMPTTDNPYALTFDPNYVYGPNQGRRLFIGFRYIIGRVAK